MTLKEKDKKYIANTYARFDVEIAYGRGSELFGIDGKRYIDMGSGIGVTSFGIADSEWTDAVTAQLLKVQHTSNLYYTQPCVELAELLCEKSGMKKVFFANSGAEANECAIKAARKYACGKKGKDVYKIITLVNSFHGRTVTTLAATGQEVFHKDFQPLTDGFLYAPANDIGAIKRLVSENGVAAIMFECIQGEGGVNPLDTEYLKAVSLLARENDILLIADEVQTGNGRTGEMYAYMHYGITPDIVTTAKGLGGGLPIGVCMFGERTENVLSYGEHGSTYGGNPVACAGAISVISRLDRECLDGVKRKSELVFKTLSGAKGIESICGMGLMIGIKTEKSAKEVVAKCMERGVLCLTAKDKVRLLPALNISDGLLAEALEVIKSACAE